jgi:hypothetical protein
MIACALHPIALFSASQNDPEYIKQLLSLLRISLSVLHRCFGDDTLVGRSLWKGTPCSILVFHVATLGRGGGEVST